jgi:DNA mismatch repair ATPase MutS
MDIYSSNSERYSQELNTIKIKYNTISLFRLTSIFLFLGTLYFYFKNDSVSLLFIAAIFFIGFLFLMRIHSKLQIKIKMLETLLVINKNEISYLEKKAIPFENGSEFNDFHHPYAYDLDVFGTDSLFQNLNRTATYIGKKTLAKQCVTLLPNDEISSNQEAVKELANNLDWRQEFLALAKMGADSKEHFQELLKWNDRKSVPFSKTTTIILFVVPAIFVGLIVAYYSTNNAIFLKYSTYVFIINLMILGKYTKQIKTEIANTYAIDTIIHKYSLLLQKIENKSFKTPKLIALQKQLHFENTKASTHLKQLSELFSKMDSISNLITATLFNGTFLYNLHILKALIKWKNTHNQTLETWLEVIGEFEMMNSLANLSYNNPDFAFPDLNTNNEISFSDLSHPLLNAKSRVGNDVDFQPQSFLILTGSNMSGKSTFLRSLGINMVLTGMGAAVCATKANVHPMPVLVSMRLSDSLSDSESYFFAEIKRLKQIMDELENGPAFVLLDEILRGTNSDDKRNGTIEVIKKVIAKKAIGAIATHDIEVCLTTNEFPNQLVNKCFEVEIVDNDLFFDYTLRNGICKNKSATFLMKKMGVI